MIYNLISAQNVRKSFRGRKKTFSLEIDALDLPAGSVQALMGPNGCGKSTLILLLAGAMAPDSGRILVNGQFSPETIQGRRHFSYLPEGSFLNPNLSGEVNLEIFSRLSAVAFGQPINQLREKTFNYLELLGLPRDELDKTVRTYSVGMRRKVELALTLAVDAPAYVLDMPTSGLDPATRQRFFSAIQGMKKQGLGFLISTHIPEEAKFADTVLFMKDGRLVKSVQPDEVKSYIASLVVVRFNPLDKERLLRAVDGVSGLIGDEEARFYNVAPERIHQLIKVENNVEVVELYEARPHLGDLYTYLTGDAIRPSTG